MAKLQGSFGAGEIESKFALPLIFSTAEQSPGCTFLPEAYP